ncbi:MAG: phosphonate metabolism protein/1,5-bisphosphokinase (PRPP-forming) PhnN [Pseudomonadota bacterium]
MTPGTPPGRVIGVVGPSGVGKDTLMLALTRARPGLGTVRRVVTRPRDLGGEAYDALDPAAFEDLRTRGAFCLDWQAHGLHYGIPAQALDRAAAGEDLLINLSRAVLVQAQSRFPRFTVLSVTARPETLRARLRARGREDAGEISSRLGRAGAALPPGLTVCTVANDGPIGHAVTHALSCLFPQKVGA